MKSLFAKIKIDKLDVIVFVAGAIIMIIELTGSRIIAPYLGLSLYVWTSIIGVILTALSIGYVLGGKFADRNPSHKTLYKILLASGFIMIAIALLKDITVALISGLGPLWGSLAASLILFLPGSVLLAMIAPYAIKLRLTDLQQTGRAAGNLYAFSTFGSISGTFLAGYVLIPNLHTSYILLLLAATLFITAFSINKTAIATSTIIAITLAASWFLIQTISKMIPTIIAVEPSAYAFILVLENVYDGEPILILKKDAEIHSGMYLDESKSDQPVFPYLKFFHLDEYFAPAPRTALLIGAGSFTGARDFLRRFPEATMDVVEIDPKITEIAKKYFKLPETDRLSVIHEDGRLFLNKNTKKYDIIYNDSFSSYMSVPYQLTTREALTKINDGLNNDGIFIVNLISSLNGPGKEFLEMEYATFRSVFAHTYAFAVDGEKNQKYGQNFILIGIKNKDFTLPDKNKFSLAIQEYLSNKIYASNPPNGAILTDEFAPVDNYIAKIQLAKN